MGVFIFPSFGGNRSPSGMVKLVQSSRTVISLSFLCIQSQKVPRLRKWHLIARSSRMRFAGRLIEELISASGGKLAPEFSAGIYLTEENHSGLTSRQGNLTNPGRPKQPINNAFIQVPLWLRCHPTAVCRMQPPAPSAAQPMRVRSSPSSRGGRVTHRSPARAVRRRPHTRACA